MLGLGLGAALAFALGVFLLGIPARAAPANTESFSTAGSGWEGYSEFVRLAQRQLGISRVRPLAALDYGILKPEDAVLIVHPTRELDEKSLGAFLADGGRVALLDDYGEGGRFLQKFNIFRIAPPADPRERLRENPELPIAFPTVSEVAGVQTGRHPMVEHVDSVVTNHPVGLKHPHLTTVLEIPSLGGNSTPLGVTGVIAGRGRLFALGDPSIFINLMLRYPGNRKFAEGLIRYLGARVEEEQPGEGELQKRGTGDPGVVYILTGAFEQVGHYGEVESLLDEFRRRAHEVKEAMSRIGEEGLPPTMATALAALLAVVILWSQLLSTLRVPTLLAPGFARTPLLAAQTGLAARAHVLSSKKASPTLALIELDAALRETIAQRLSEPAVPAASELTERLEKAGLSSQSARDTSTLLTLLREYGQSLAEGKPRRTTESDLKRLHERARRHLDEIERISTHHE